MRDIASKWVLRNLRVDDMEIENHHNFILPHQIDLVFGVAPGNPREIGGQCLANSQRVLLYIGRRALIEHLGLIEYEA